MKNLILAVMLVAACALATDYMLVYEGTVKELDPTENTLSGACYVDADGVIALVMSFDNDYGVWTLDPNTGYGTSLTWLDPANDHPFGVAAGHGLTNMYYTNDWQDDHSYVYTGTYWYDTVTFTDTHGRGMDVDDDGYILETDYTPYSQLSKLWRYADDFTDEQVWDLPELNQQASGLTCFTMGGAEYVAVAQYGSNHDIALYSYDGASGPSFECFMDFPVSDCSVVRGLAYSQTRETMFLVYQASSGYWTVIEASVQEDEALQRSTWGSIKAGGSR